MALTHTIGTTYRSNNGSVSVPTLTLTGDGEVVYDGSIAAGATNVEVAMAIDVSAMKAMAIVASGALVIKTNSSSTPADTITLTDSVKSIVWYTGSTFTNPLTTDVTALYVSNAGASAVTLKVVALLDITPGV